MVSCNGIATELVELDLNVYEVRRFSRSLLVAPRLPLLYWSRFSELLFLVSSSYGIMSTEYHRSSTDLHNVPIVLNIITPLLLAMVLKSAFSVPGNSRMNVPLVGKNLLILYSNI